LHINRLRLVNFRNYKFLDAEFGKGFNVIYGNNAQGKTNILEAIYLCATGRSHRTSKDLELVRYAKEPAEGYEIGLSMETRDSSCDIRIKYDRNLKKRISVNEMPIKRFADLMGHLNAVIFSPENLAIVKDGPSERRRFIDILISQLRPSYFYDLQQYAKIVFQRNILLKEINTGKKKLDILDIWNEQLANTGSDIMVARIVFLKRLAEKVEARNNSLTNYKDELKINYSPSFEIPSDGGQADSKIIKEAFLKELERNFDNEVKRCVTLVGPHRDDYEILLNGSNAKIYGSQGQQRTAVLAIKLAEIDIMKEERGENPVLLLDDVLSELDSDRRNYLFSNINDIQAFITCTDKDDFNIISEKARFYRVVDGKICKN